MKKLTIKTLKFSDYQKQTWKNGQGVTFEIARDVQEPFRWRISMADIKTDGPFSLFPNYERHIMTLDGGPVTLTSQSGTTKKLRPFENYIFSGDESIHAIVDSPAQDLNVMVLKNKMRAQIETYRVKEKQTIRKEETDACFLFVAEGELEILNNIYYKKETVQFIESKTMSFDLIPQEKNKENIGILISIFKQ